VKVYIILEITTMETKYLPVSLHKDK